MEHRPTLLVDSGPFIAWFYEADQHAGDMEAWRQRQLRRRDFGRWVTLDHVVDETHTFLLRNAGWDVGEVFLRAVLADPMLRVDQVPPEATVRRRLSVPAARRDGGLTFTDAALAEFGARHGIRHVLSFDRALGGLGLEVVVPGE